MKHKVKVQYVVEVEGVSHAMAISKAMASVPDETTNITTECWTPKQKLTPVAGDAVMPVGWRPSTDPLPSEQDLCPRGCGHKVGQHDYKTESPAGCLARDESGYCPCDWPKPVEGAPIPPAPVAVTEPETVSGEQADGIDADDRPF